MHSLDKYKPELNSLSFPLFVHCYFKLLQHQPPVGANGIADDHLTLAAAFLDRWSASLAQQPEMRQIMAITRPEHLDADFPKVLRESRFLVNLSCVSYELVNSFLATNSLLLLISILNDHVTVALQDREPFPNVQVAQLQDMGLVPESTVSKRSGQ